jgi:murein L,D-transpeptidase YcbB/YkuD
MALVPAAASQSGLGHEAHPAFLRRRSVRALLLALLIALIAPAAHAAVPWSRPAASALLDYGQRIASHGLDPADYALDSLQWALAAQEQPMLDAAATRSFALIARDLANGHVPAGQRRLSYLRGTGLTPEAAVQLVDQALAANDVAGTLERLAPAHADYRALRAALVSLPAGAQAERALVRANLERWRWLPRDLGERHLLVNLPEFMVRLVDRGSVSAAHRVIIGKRATPTPQFSATVTGVILNPAWRVPQSIIAESVGALVRNRPAEARRRGYTWSRAGGGLSVTQQPGPGNALGQLKLDMPNPLAIYLHDTPSKALFDQKVRAYSHGCIRTDRPLELGARLLAGTDWTAERIARTVAGRETTTARLPRPVPVHVAYFTVRANPDGSLSRFDDIYGLDAALSKLLGAAAPARAPGLAYSECAAAIGG